MSPCNFQEEDTFGSKLKLSSMMQDPSYNPKKNSGIIENWL